MLWDGGEKGTERLHGMGSYGRGCRCVACRAAKQDYTVRRAIKRKLEKMRAEDAEQWEMDLERRALEVAAIERQLKKRQKS